MCSCWEQLQQRWAVGAGTPELCQHRQAGCGGQQVAGVEAGKSALTPLSCTEAAPLLFHLDSLKQGIKSSQMQAGEPTLCFCVVSLLVWRSLSVQ